MSDELPRRRWELSAPESQMLLWGPETGDAWVLKLAITELIVRRVLRLVVVPERRLLVFSRRTTVLAPALRLDDSASRALSAVVVAFPKTRTYADGTTGAAVDKVAREVFNRYRKSGSVEVQGTAWSWSTGGFGRAVVLPALEGRGLYRQERSTRLGLFDTTHWELTPVGLTALEDLRQIMAIGRGPFVEWVARDPARAVAFVELAGPALLLLGGLGPSIPRLWQWSANRGDQGPVFAGDAKQAMHPWGASAFSLAALAGVFGPGALDDLDAVFYAIAEEVDRAWETTFGSGGGE